MEADVIQSPGTPPDRPGSRPDRPSGPSGVTELFRDHHLELVRLALLVVGDLATAEDVVQDAFEQLHRRWHALRRQSSALDYARATVLNRCRSVHRRRGVARRYEPVLVAPASQASDATAAIEQRSELFVAFGKLPTRQREVLALRYYLDLSVTDTASTLRISESAVRSTGSRGLAALARILHGEEG
jgi:RNA polymerase sigma-70 factor (sigma-E family)